MNVFRHSHWHGNVGVLENTLEHAFILCRRTLDRKLERLEFER